MEGKNLNMPTGVSTSENTPEEFTEADIQAQLQVVNTAFEEIVKEIETKGQFEEVMQRVAAQEKWDGQSYGGEMDDICFAGGFSEDVFGNILYKLGFGYGTKVSKELQIATLQRAVQENPKIKLYVDSIISAVKIVNKKTYENLKGKPTVAKGELRNDAGEIMEEIIYGKK